MILQIIENFITEDQEIELLQLMNNLTFRTVNGSTRLVSQYGFEYDYRNYNVNPTDPIPDELRLPGIPEQVEQLIINRYIPGEGIGAQVYNGRQISLYLKTFYQKRYCRR